MFKKLYAVTIAGVFSSLLFINAAFAQYPPFSAVTIIGKTKPGYYNRVSLFKNGAAKRPIKTSNVSKDGTYNISISIPADMHYKNGYYVTDMRFWKDENLNGIKDDDETWYSACHFVGWMPSKRQVFMQVYNGGMYKITSRNFTYNYNK